MTEHCRLSVSPGQFTAEVDSELEPLLDRAALLPGAARLVTHLAANRVPLAIASRYRRHTFLV